MALSRVLTLALSGAACFACLAPASAAAPTSVDLELVLATDVSGSISPAEAALQREGVAAAFRDPQVMRAISSGSLGKIAVAYIDWTNEEFTRVVVDWRVISNKAGAEAFAKDLLAAPPTPSSRTSISTGIALAAKLILENDISGTRRAIDVSGDGPNNLGLPLAPVRDEAIAKGITINGLPIMVEGEEFRGRGFFPDIDKYYNSCVIGGKGAFMVVAKGLKDFAAAIRHKLILEISDATPLEQPQIIRAAATPRLKLAQLNPAQTPQVVPAPATREQDCDRFNGFGGFGGFGGFR